jgi:hypothetical protein
VAKILAPGGLGCAKNPVLDSGIKSPLAVQFCVLANEARTKKGECRVNEVKGHMNDSWYRLRPLLAAPLVVHRRYLIEVPSPLPAAPLVVRRTVLWPLCRCVLRVLSRGALAVARPVVRAQDSTLLKGCL